MFASLGGHLWLSTRIEPWLSAVLLGLVALVLALAAMPVGGALLRQRSRRDRDEVLGALTGRGVLSNDRPPDLHLAACEGGPGLVLSRSLPNPYTGRTPR